MNLDARVSKYTGDGGVVSKAEIARRIREDVIGDYKRYGYGRLALVLKHNSEFIGFCGLKYLPDMQKTDLGYRLMYDHWGHGYTTEAAKACLEQGFGKLNLQEIIAMTLPENAASIRVLNKLGFVFNSTIIEEGQKAKLFSLRKQDFDKFNHHI